MVAGGDAHAPDPDAFTAALISAAARKRDAPQGSVSVQELPPPGHDDAAAARNRLAIIPVHRLRLEAHDLQTPH
jgi:hypothetical protein